MDKKDLLIKEYKHWIVFLHQNQCYLGRFRIWAKREDAVDYFGMTEEEARELLEIGKELHKVLKELFDPDLYNYYFAGNVDPHLHMHFIPRYSHKVEFEGMTFVDENWGKNHAPYSRDFKISDEMLIKIRDAIKENLEG